MFTLQIDQIVRFVQVPQLAALSQNHRSKVLSINHHNIKNTKNTQNYLNKVCCSHHVNANHDDSKLSWFGLAGICLLFTRHNLRRNVHSLIFSYRLIRVMSVSF